HLSRIPCAATLLKWHCQTVLDQMNGQKEKRTDLLQSDPEAPSISLSSVLKVVQGAVLSFSSCRQECSIEHFQNLVLSIPYVAVLQDGQTPKVRSLRHI